MNFYKHPKLLEALDLYTREQDERLPDEKELKSITFSEEFLERMRRMIARHRWGYYALFGTVGRRVASILVALLIAATTATVSVEALREPVLRFFAEVFEKFTAIFVVNDVPAEPTAEMELYAPTYVPEGYTVESETKTQDVYHVTYTRADGNRIKYSQRWNSNVSRTIDTEGVDYSKITIDQHSGISYTNKNVTTVAFWFDAYNYTLTGAVPQEELIKIAKSVTKIK